MGSQEDEEIARWARKIKASDERAFSKLFHHLYPRLLKFSWRYTQTKTAAKDVVQESFVKLWTVRSDIDPAQSLRAYLFQMVRNRSLNYIRDHSSDNIPIDDLPAGLLKTSESVPGMTSAQNVNKEEKIMLCWIDELPDRQQEAIRLSRFEGLDHKEIAYVMDISARTVNNHIGAALNKLKQKWTNYKEETTKG